MKARKHTREKISRSRDARARSARTSALNNVVPVVVLPTLFNVLNILLNIVTPDCGLIQAQHAEQYQRVDTTKREMFSQKSVRRFVSIRHGRHVLSQCPKERHSPFFNISGG